MGLGAAKAFVLAILVIAILGVVSLLVLNEVRKVDQYGDGAVLTTVNTSFINTSSALPVYPTGLSSGDLDCVLSNTSTVRCANGTSSMAIPQTWFTLVDCTVVPTGTANATCNGTLELNYWYSNWSYTKSSKSSTIYHNTSQSVADFFSNAGTWFTLLAVIVIIMIIAVVIVVVNRFGGGEAGGARDFGTPGAGGAIGGGGAFGYSKSSGPANI